MTAAACLYAATMTAQHNVFVYNPDPAGGLRIAVRQDTVWHDLGRLCSSDYGTWGAEKKMYNPCLCRAADGSWRLVFQVNNHSPLFAAAYSRDLITWRPQDYVRVSTPQCLRPVVQPAAPSVAPSSVPSVAPSSAPSVAPSSDLSFNVYYISGDGALRQLSASHDFRHFTADAPATSVDPGLWQRDTVVVINPASVRGGSPASVGSASVPSPASVGSASVRGGFPASVGQCFTLTDAEIEKIADYFHQQAADWRLSNERMHDDADPNNSSLFALYSSQAQAQATLTVYPDSEKVISDKLIGIFFEDISYAADGGLYAELVQNRDFEYSAKDHGGWNATTAWSSQADIKISDEQPLTPQNPHYAVVTNKTLTNEGWDGMLIESGHKYDFSIFVRGSKMFYITLRGDDGSILGTGRIKAKGDEWKRYECVILASKTNSKAHLELMPEGTDEACIDMVSLFPRETFKHRKNGLRKDLAQVIADLHPKFVRFPGGCMSHGQGLENIYHWQHTVGPLESRTPDFNIWHYHQTRGLGFYEYFQFCEDIGAEPLPVLAAGVPCQNSAANAEGVGGQQGGIPMDEMPAYVEEICNLIEWANGDPATNEWARMRAEAGHHKPFNLKYLGLGNEDIISTVFEERYEMLCKAVRERYPDIKICGTVGPFHSPSADYVEGWDFTRTHPDLQYMVDEHYYESTGWFMHHRNYYDNYPRTLNSQFTIDNSQSSILNSQSSILNSQSSILNTPKVYLGEWAASTKVKRPNVETALAEALYLTDIERNGDIVEMTSYAPMLCKDGHSNWNPDMIYFSNTGIRTTPAYEIQRLFSVYSGDRYVSSNLIVSNTIVGDAVMPGVKLSHRVGASLVRDSKTGRQYLKLVNALPCTLKVSVQGLTIPSVVKCQQFTGAIDDQKAKAVEIETSEPTTLPPYSLRVIAL